MDRSEMLERLDLIIAAEQERFRNETAEVRDITAHLALVNYMFKLLNPN